MWPISADTLAYKLSGQLQPVVISTETRPKSTIRCQVMGHYTIHTVIIIGVQKQKLHHIKSVSRQKNKTNLETPYTGPARPGLAAHVFLVVAFLCQNTVVIC